MQLNSAAQTVFACVEIVYKVGPSSSDANEMNALIFSAF